MLPGGNGGAESKEDPTNKKKISTDKPVGYMPLCIFTNTIIF